MTRSRQPTRSIRFAASCSLVAALALVAATSAAAAAAWVPARPYAAPHDGVAACLRSGGPGELAALGALGRTTSATDLLHVGERAIARRASTTLGWLTGCPRLAHAAGQPALLAAPVYDPATRGWAVRVLQEGGRAVDLRRSRSEELFPPAVAVAPSGAAVVAWYEDPAGAAGRRLVLAARPRAGVPFGPVRTVATATIGNPVTAPGLGVDAAGAVTILWQSGSSANAVRVATVGGDGRLSGLQTLARARDSDGPSLAVAPDGGALVAVPGETRLEAYERLPGAGAFVPVVLPVARDTDGALAVALASGGGAVIADRTEPDTVVAFTRAPGGGFGAPHLLAGRLANDVSGQFSIYLEDGRPRRPQAPTDSEQQALSAAIGPGGEVVVTWVDPPTDGRADAARVARGTLAGGFGRAEHVGGSCRKADAVTPFARADGTLGVAWADNARVGRSSSVDETVAGGGAVHAARFEPGGQDARDRGPAGRPRAIVTVAGSRSLRLGQPLRLRVRCDGGPCDVRVVTRAWPHNPVDPVADRDADDGDYSGESPTSGRAEWRPSTAPVRVSASTALASGEVGELRLAPRSGYRIGTAGSSRPPVRATTCAAGGDVTAQRVLRPRVRGVAPAPVPWLRDVTAERRDGAIVVSWRTAAPARDATFFLTAWTRGWADYAHPPMTIAGRGRTRFSVAIPVTAAKPAHHVTLDLRTRDGGDLDDETVVLGRG